jgi:glycosyltransferase involved in cell wall biosynthesis
VIKILYFYPNAFLGPVMSVFCHIIRHLDRSRFEAHVALNTEASGTLYLDPEHAIIHRFGFAVSPAHGSIPARAAAAAQIAPAMAQVIALARREKIDVLQCASTPYAGSLGTAVAKLSGAKLLVHYHDLVGRYSGHLGEHSRARKLAAHAMAAASDQLVTVSQFVREQGTGAGLPANKIDVVVNGVNLKRFTPEVDRGLRKEYGIADDEVLVLQLGRLLQSKRPDDFVRALAIARKKAPKVRGLIVGWEDPHYVGSFPGFKAELQHLADEAKLGDGVIFGDPRPDAHRLMAAADLVVAPSIDDPCPLVVTEAMAAGKAVVGARSGGIPEMVAHGETGFLVEPCNPDAIAEKLVELALDPDKRAAQGKAGRARAEKYFNEERLAAQFAPIYERLARR